MAKMLARVVKAETREAEIRIYEDIGDPWGMGWGITAKRFAEQLKALGEVDKITVYINSLGGDIFDGMAIYNELKRSSAWINVHVSGIAASAASVIAMAAGRGRLTMEEGSLLMIHKAWTIRVGNADEMREMAATLDKTDENMAGIYARRSGQSVEAIMAAMTAETWYSADEAVEAGLADKAIKTEMVGGDESGNGRAAAWGNERLVASFRNIPAAVKGLLAAVKGKDGGDGGEGEEENSSTSTSTSTSTNDEETGEQELEPGVGPAGPSDAERVARLRLLDLENKAKGGCK
jgi:ATP-dependent Clp endopeptidase proteolytic subunit ClpP